MYTNLASLARYGHVDVTLDNPKYAAAISQLEADDRQRAAAAFTLQDIHGHTWEGKDLRGKVVLVNFWSTSCPPCREEMPDLEQLYQRFRGQGLIVLAISGDQPADLRKYLAAQKLSLPLLIDPDDKVKKQFRVVGIPKTFLYDREGNLAGQTLDRPSTSGWIELLRLAGLN
jgi:peroxiredoxin